MIRKVTKEGDIAFRNIRLFCRLHNSDTAHVGIHTANIRSTFVVFLCGRCRWFMYSRFFVNIYLFNSGLAYLNFYIWFVSSVSLLFALRCPRLKKLCLCGYVFLKFLLYIMGKVNFGGIPN